MSATRLRSERQFHDAQARSRAATFDREPSRLRFSDAEYLDHEPWVRPAMKRLGDVRGRSVLDLGCGHGMAAVTLARRGAIVTATDLSRGYVAEARQRAAANGVRVTVSVADAEHLPFAEHSFDAIWGHAILHHLDVPVATREIRRVLRPGGVAVLCEPWGGNPLLSAARRLLQHTADETMLKQTHVDLLRRVFTDVDIEGWQLLGMVNRILPWGDRLATVDRRILRWIPKLSNWCRYVVIALR
jgi:ubiquinone/menaquinone biosynthesis C-methylase UbiE